LELQYASMSTNNTSLALNDQVGSESAQDYYPFGMLMPNRTFSSDKYRFGFNGKENDNEVKGTGDQQDYGMRIYDPRLGRFLSVDPITKKYPELTPYQFASNRTIDGIDLDGLETFPANAIQGKAGEIFIKSKLQVSDAFDVYEQVTLRPDGTTAAYNSRVDFLIRSTTTGNYYTIDVKTGKSPSSTNQLTVDRTIGEGDLLEMRSGPAKGTGIPKGEPVKVGGSAVIRTNPSSGSVNIENVTLNPKVKGTSDDLNTIETLLKSGTFKITEPEVIPEVTPEVMPEIMPEVIPEIVPL